MIIEKLKDQWICSCRNWVDHNFTWCPECCEEQNPDSNNRLEKRMSAWQGGYTFKKERQ